MKLILGSHSLYIGGAIVLVLLAIIFLINAATNKQEPPVTAKVTRGDVTELVSVSGVVEAENTASLAFPGSGIVKEVLVNEGDEVEAGAVLAKLEQSILQADRLDAIAAVQTARANRDELVAGPRTESRIITDSSISLKQETLEQTKKEQAQKVDNTLRTLLSSGLEVVSKDPSENAVAPTVTGTYNCSAQGVYDLEVYSSAARVGYSVRVTGIETGTYSASTNHSAPLGECGLYIQFDEDSWYPNSEWQIEIPNTRSSSYVTNLNAYELAKNQAENAIEAAERALTLAEQEATLANADPRIEALQRANASIAQAEARLARVNAQISDRTLVAPFSGVITDVSVIAGETVTTVPIITLLAENAFDLTARIPEIDIAKVEEGQKAEVVFDANGNETIKATIEFISPIATEIDGVAYYKAILQFDETPTWIRSGLNADIDIIVSQRIDTLKIPIRFLNSQTDIPTVLMLRAGKISSTPVETGFIGNDGFVEIIGLNEGDTIVAP